MNKSAIDLKAPDTQQTIPIFYKPLDTCGREQQLAREYAALRTRAIQRAKKEKLVRRKIQQGERSIGMITQNVMGMRKDPANIGSWYQHFRQRGPEGSHDLVLLQETHVESHEVGAMTGQHCRHWGFLPEASSGGYSLWSPSILRSGGLGIL